MASEVRRPSTPALDVRNLRIGIRRGREELVLVDDVSFSVAPGQRIRCGRGIRLGQVDDPARDRRSAAGRGRGASGEVDYAGRGSAVDAARVSGAP